MPNKRNDCVTRTRHDDDVAVSLLQLGNQAGTTTRIATTKRDALCPLCGEVFYHGSATYDLCRPVKSVTIEERKLVRAGRQHIRKKHSGAYLWNLLPPRRILLHDIRSEIDVLFCRSMIAAAKQHSICPDDGLAMLILSLICRLTAAKSWLSWIVPRKLVDVARRQGKNEARRIAKLTLSEVEKLLSIALKRSIEVEMSLVQAWKRSINANVHGINAKVPGITREVFNELNTIAHMPGYYRRSWLLSDLSQS